MDGHKSSIRYDDDEENEEGGRVEDELLFYPSSSGLIDRYDDSGLALVDGDISSISSRRSVAPATSSNGGITYEGPIKIAQYYKNFSLSNPSSAHASPEKGALLKSSRRHPDQGNVINEEQSNMSMVNSMFSPTFGRRPPSGRAAGSGGGGGGGGFGAGGGMGGVGGFQGPSSLPHGGDSYTMRASARHQQIGDDRRSNLQRMRVHRSLDAELPYDPSSGVHLMEPPADPSVNVGVDYLRQQTSSPLLYGAGGTTGSLSQGNLLNISSSVRGGLGDNVGGGPFSNALTSAYSTSGVGQFGGGVGLNMATMQSNPGVGGGAPTSALSMTGLTNMDTTSGATSSNPYHRHYQQQQQQQQQLAGSSYFTNPFSSRDPFSMPLPTLQREYEILRREYENSMQKLNSTMNSIKTFWSPELKKERAMRKEETAKFALIQEQLRMSSQEGQVGTVYYICFGIFCGLYSRIRL